MEFSTAFTTDLFRWQKMFYPNGKKIIPQNIGDHLTPQAMAVWYMDDGSVEKAIGRRGGRKTYTRTVVNIYTNGFAKSDCELLAATIFSLYEIDFKLHRVDKGKHYVLQTKNRQSVVRFFRLISPFVIPSMQYKLKTYYDVPARRMITPNRIVKIMNKLGLRRYGDFTKYRRGKRLYTKAIWHFKSISQAAKKADLLLVAH